MQRESTVCLLDDDSSVLKSLVRLLASAGWGAQSFEDPTEFLNYAQRERPSLAVLDVRMPTMHGLEVQSRLKAASPSTRVIMVSSNDDLFVRITAIANGATAFLVKPVNPDELLSHIDAVLGGATANVAQ